MAKANSIFRSIITDARQGTVIKPLLHSYLFEADWPEDFSITFKKGSSTRPPDGWFHPSQHPTWPERMLWFYLTQPDKMISEKFAYMNTMSVTVGTAMHGFIETCLRHIGILAGPDTLQELGFSVNSRDGEPGAEDRPRLSRGHMDGVVRVSVPQYLEYPYHLFEFKSSNEMALRSIDDLDLEGFMKKWPTYYAQAQEYLRISGMN